MMIIGHAGLNPDFDSDIDQKVDFQEFLNFTEPIITKWVDIFSGKFWEKL